jgi:hypothetical protein
LAELMARAVVNRLEDRGIVEFHDAEAAIAIVARALETDLAEINTLEQEARQRLGNRATDQQIEAEVRRIAAKKQIPL